MFSVRIWSSICSAGTRAQGFFFRYSSENWTFLVRSTSSVSYGSPASSSAAWDAREQDPGLKRSEEHTSELQSLMRISYAVFCLKKNKTPVLYTPISRLSAIATQNYLSPPNLSNTQHPDG